MKIKTAGLAFLAVTAGALVFTWTNTGRPSDLRDAVADNKAADFDTRLPAFKKGGGNIPEPKAVAVKDVSKAGIAGNASSAGKPATPIEWVAINAGKFIMGTNEVDPSRIFENARPRHEVAVKTFDMTKTDVTIEQYAECVVKGRCTEPKTNADSGLAAYCNWGKPDRRFHPVNCVTWNQANQYARFKGARLPSEAEWEYAATSGGRDQKYPWGNEKADCGRAVMQCNENAIRTGTMQVCSKPAGNTAQGLCDMAGNVWQWVQDKYRDSYSPGAPIEALGAYDHSQVVRGGSWNDSEKDLALRVHYRTRFPPGESQNNIGFRLARSRPK